MRYIILALLYMPEAMAYRYASGHQAYENNTGLLDTIWYLFVALVVCKVASLIFGGTVNAVSWVYMYVLCPAKGASHDRAMAGIAASRAANAVTKAKGRKSL
jgi:hypothetical protein